jgi:hypothetical protein
MGVMGVMGVMVVEPPPPHRTPEGGERIPWPTPSSSSATFLKKDDLKLEPIAFIPFVVPCRVPSLVVDRKEFMMLRQESKQLMIKGDQLITRT